MTIVLAMLLLADQEVAIEVPVAARYELAAKQLVIEDAAGVTRETARTTIALCDDGLCPPLEALQPPLKIRAQGPVSVNDRRLQGGLWAIVREKEIVLVNRLPLEEYLVATVGSEMPKSFPKEALKAQAVAARTYALSRKITREGAIAHLRSSTLDQVYGGIAHESKETRAAVQATAGEVLVYERQPIEAFFFSSCSGHTRDGELVFGGDSPSGNGVKYPYLKAVDCACGGEVGWSARVSLPELSKKLGQKVQSLVLDGETADGRPQAIVVQPSGARFTGEELRKKIGYTIVKSASLHVECDTKGCRFFGVGYGHGVGMCQHGAKAMAEKGNDYRSILDHYYPGAQIKKL